MILATTDTLAVRVHTEYARQNKVWLVGGIKTKSAEWDEWKRRLGSAKTASFQHNKSAQHPTDTVEQNITVALWLCDQSCLSIDSSEGFAVIVLIKL